MRNGAAGELMLVAVLVTGLLAGCSSPAAPPPDGDLHAPRSLYVLPTATALWNDPQHFPHPMFRWPTITHVPDDAPDLWQPLSPRPIPVSLQGLEHIARLDPISSGADGIVVFGSIAVVQGAEFIHNDDDDAVDLIDLTNPRDPRLLASFTPEVPARAAELIAYPDGRLVVILTTSSGILLVYDITQPDDALFLAMISPPSGTHNAAVVPGTPIVYNANTVGSGYYQETQGGRSLHQTEIYDLTDPAAPVLVDEWPNGYGCHDIQFYQNESAGKLRAYCAGVDAVQIWDIEDPRKPRVVSTFPFPYARSPLPGIPTVAPTLAHSVIVNRDATILAVSDEVFGSLPACTSATSIGSETVTGPTGNLWFYDVTDETNPVLVASLTPGAQTEDLEGSPTQGWPCTAHLGRMVPHPERDLLAITFYQGGLLLVDFTEPTNPWIVDRWDVAGREPVDVWYAGGYLFVADFRDGFDVLTFR